MLGGPYGFRVLVVSQGMGAGLIIVAELCVWPSWKFWRLADKAVLQRGWPVALGPLMCPQVFWDMDVAVAVLFLFGQARGMMGLRLRLLRMV